MMQLINFLIISGVELIAFLIFTICSLMSNENKVYVKHTNIPKDAVCCILYIAL